VDREGGAPHKVRFTIGGLMAIVLVAAIGFAALANPNEIWAGMLPVLVYGLLGLAIIGIVIRPRAARAWWIGWAVFEWGYLQMANTPAWMWGSLSRYLPTLRLLEVLRVKLGFLPKVGFNVGFAPEEVAFAQIGHCLWAVLAGLVGATLARAFFALPALPALDPQAETQGVPARRPMLWFRVALAILLVLALIATVIAIWSTPDARLWAGGTYLLTCGLLGIAALAAFFSHGRAREICIGAALFGAGYLYLAMAHARFPYVRTAASVFHHRPVPQCPPPVDSLGHNWNHGRRFPHSEGTRAAGPDGVY